MLDLAFSNSPCDGKLQIKAREFHFIKLWSDITEIYQATALPEATSEAGRESTTKPCRDGYADGRKRESSSPEQNTGQDATTCACEEESVARLGAFWFEPRRLARPFSQRVV